ncbi:MAG: alpha/beta fold hydrolase [Rhodobacteraceae bacterium]|nr:alpha/beta fold hydrolase [Paracoccaceae bacterium]
MWFWTGVGLIALIILLVVARVLFRGVFASKSGWDGSVDVQTNGAAGEPDNGDDGGDLQPKASVEATHGSAPDPVDRTRSSRETPAEPTEDYDPGPARMEETQAFEAPAGSEPEIVGGAYDDPTEDTYYPEEEYLEESASPDEGWEEAEPVDEPTGGSNGGGQDDWEESNGGYTDMVAANGGGHHDPGPPTADSPGAMPVETPRAAPVDVVTTEPAEPVFIKKGDWTEVRILFGTDRKPENTEKKYGTERHRVDGKDVIEYGECLVTIPAVHVEGKIESPSWKRFEFSEKPEKHVVLSDIDDMTQDAWKAVLGQRLQASATRSSLVFIHGFQNSFEAAAKRTAQLSYDLPYTGVPIFFSWPSKEDAKLYTQDKTTSDWSIPHVRQFLIDIAEQDAEAQVFVIAHSMGGRIASEVFGTLFDKRPDLIPRFAEIILAAPDIDKQIFTEQIAPEVAKASVNLTVYQSDNDKALKISKGINGEARLGDTSDGITVGTGFETIDASNTDTGLLSLAHSYFSQQSEMLDDIADIITHRKRPESRLGRLEELDMDGKTYWSFK